MMDGGRENLEHLHITREVFPVHAVAFVFVGGVTFLRARQTAEHTPSVPVIYRLVIDILQSETLGMCVWWGGGHMPASSMDPWRPLKRLQSRRKGKNKRVLELA